MTTMPWIVERWCPACGRNVTVRGTHIVQRNAAGEALIDEREGADDAGHVFHA